jgi:hypothetical protein
MMQGGTAMMQGGTAMDDIETAMATYLRGKQLQDPQAKVQASLSSFPSSPSLRSSSFTSFFFFHLAESLLLSPFLSSFSVLQYQLFRQAENLLLNTSLFPGPTQERRNKDYVTTMNKICGSMLKLRNVYPTLDTSQRRRTPHEHLKLVKYITKTNMGTHATLSRCAQHGG